MQQIGKSLLTLLSLCVLLLGAGCIGDNSSGDRNIIDVDPRLDQRYFEPPSRSVINQRDKITVVLSDFPKGPAKYPLTVDDSGSVVLHLNQVFQVSGKTPTAVQTEIHQRYVPSYYPRMTVQVSAEEQFFFVQGHVNNPNRFPYSSGMTVMKSISTASGFDPFAKKWAVIVTRQDGQKFRVNCEKAKTDSRYDLPIFPGDRINVPRRIY